MCAQLSYCTALDLFVFLHVFRPNNIPQTHLWKKDFSPFRLLLSLPSLYSYSHSNFPRLFSSPLSPSLLCVRAVRVDLPVPLPPSTPADSTTRADTRLFPQSCSHPVTLCLISSAVMWNCVLLSVCVCVRETDKLAAASLGKCWNCHWVHDDGFQHWCAHTHIQTHTWATCRSIIYKSPTMTDREASSLFGLISQFEKVCY